MKGFYFAGRSMGDIWMSSVPFNNELCVILGALDYQNRVHNERIT